MEKLLVHQVDISHYRLVELIKLADSAKPFYQWVERIFKRCTNSHRSFPELIFNDKVELRTCIAACFQPAANEALPILFDGVGRSYPHQVGCFYFFSWLIRDAPKQRLEPLIAEMRRSANVIKLDAQLDTLTELIVAYRSEVKFFAWESLREIFIDRLEGSRRSLKGHEQEAFVRAAFVVAIQNHYSIHNNYGLYHKVSVEATQVQRGAHSFDVAVRLTRIDGTERMLYVPVKSRETQGGGHSHLFTRDIMTAITETRQADTACLIIVVVISDNWSTREVQNLTGNVDCLFHFNVNPNLFQGFDEVTQISLNTKISAMLTPPQT